MSVAFNTTVARGDVAEGCAEATSGVDLLRFGAYSRNDGTADFVLGDPLCPTPVRSASARGLRQPRLHLQPGAGPQSRRTTTTTPATSCSTRTARRIVVGHKQGYCLRDTNCADPVLHLHQPGHHRRLLRPLRREPRLPVPRHHRRPVRYLHAAGDDRSLQPHRRALRDQQRRPAVGDDRPRADAARRRPPPRRARPRRPARRHQPRPADGHGHGDDDDPNRDGDADGDSADGDADADGHGRRQRQRRRRRPRRRTATPTVSAARLADPQP